MADANENKEKDAKSSQGASKPNSTDIIRNPNDMLSSKETQQTREEFQKWAKEAGFSPSFPHDFIPKWPLTRAERIRELDFLSQHYNKVGQKENIDAAKKWHSRFPSDQIIPDEVVIFQDGKIVKESELQFEGGAIWEEEPPSDDFMSGNIQGTSQSFAPPGPPTAVSHEVNWTYFERSSNSHMYELLVEVQVPIGEHGTGQLFTLNVGYDTGCATMAVPLGDITPYIAPGGLDRLRRITTHTASGPSTAYRATLMVRVLCRGGILVPWHFVRCNIYQHYPRRIFRGALESQLFLCNHPELQRLYAARTKPLLLSRMPK